MADFPTSVSTWTDKTDGIDFPEAEDVNQPNNEIIAVQNYLIEAPTEKTVSSGVLTVDKSRHKVQPESGTADDIVTISGMPSNSELILYASDKGTDTLTFKHGTGNLSCSGGADITLSQGYVKCFYDGTTVYVQPSGLTAAAIAGLHGVTLNGVGTQIAAPTDATTYFAGLSNRAPSSVYNNFKVPVPITGTIKRVYINMDTTGVGTNETSTMSIRLNDTTDSTISSAVANDANNLVISNTSMSVAVTAGDTFVIKWVTPTWATDPTNVRINWVVWIEV